MPTHACHLSRNIENSTNQGFTLLELMIGIGLGVVVLSGVIAVYIPSIQTWNTSMALIQLHDTELLAQDIISTHIRQSASLACGDHNRIINGIDPDIQAGSTKTWAFKESSDNDAINGFSGRSIQSFSASDQTTIKALLDINSASRLSSNSTNNTFIGDVFYTLSPATGFYRVRKSISGNGKKSLELSSSRVESVHIRKGAFYLINDCTNPVLVRASRNSSKGVLEYHNQQLNAYQHPLQTVVSEFEPAIYYLGNFKLPDHSMVPTLYKRVISKTIKNGHFTTIDQAILSGVANLRIEYGLARNDEQQKTDFIVRYHTINMLPENSSLDDVFAIRFNLMIQAPGNLTSAELIFPDLDGNRVNCYRATAKSAMFESACPPFVRRSKGRQASYKTIEFNVVLPQNSDI